MTRRERFLNNLGVMRDIITNVQCSHSVYEGALSLGALTTSSLLQQLVRILAASPKYQKCVDITYVACSQFLLINAHTLVLALTHMWV